MAISELTEAELGAESKTFTKEDTDPNLDNARKVKEWANKWAEREVISEEQVNWICNDQPKPAVIYANIKTDYDHWPIRQIISANGKATENLAKWIEIQLKPLATKHEPYIKDTKSILAHIEKLNKDYAPFPEGTRLITWDIENYYPNYDTPMCIQAVKKALDKWGENF